MSLISRYEMGKGESRKSYVVIVELVDPRLAMVVEDQNGRNHVSESAME